MVTHFDTLAPQDTLDRASELLLSTHQQDFPVVDAWGRVAGVLPRSALLQGLARLGRAGAVLEVMDREVAVVGPDAPLDDILPQLGRRPGHPVLVVDGGRLLGMITFDNLVELIEISQRLQTAG
jgi:CBS-domain-containing membrane protein